MAPSKLAFKSLLHQNLTKNWEVTEKDIMVAENLFGPDLATLKVRSTSPKRKKVVDEKVEPDEVLPGSKELELVSDMIL